MLFVEVCVSCSNALLPDTDDDLGGAWKHNRNKQRCVICRVTILHISSYITALANEALVSVMRGIYSSGKIISLDTDISNEYTVYTVNIQYTGGISLDIIISNASNQPIYEQIYTQIKNNIISGRLSEGDMLPSIRALAKDLRISVITTKRAYEELEKDGYIYTVPAKGCFVAKRNVELIREWHLKEIEDHLQKISELASACGITNDELIEMLRILKREE